MNFKTYTSIPLSLVLGTAFLGLGLSMPSCPGQQAMQDQIDPDATSPRRLSTKKIQKPRCPAQERSLTHSTQMKAGIMPNHGRRRARSTASSRA